MRNLVCITSEEGKDLFYILSNRGELSILSTEEVTEEIKQGGYLLVDNLYLENDELKINNEDLFRSGKGTEKKYGPAHTILIYVEGRGTHAKHAGYKAFNPVKREVEVFSRSAYVGLVKKYGCLNGAVKAIGTSTVEIVTGKVKEVPAEKNVAVYLKAYHGARNYLQKQGRESDKIVRTTLKDLELRSVAPVETRVYNTPKGVSSINIKNWKADEFSRLFIKAKPVVGELVLGEMVRDIEINTPAQSNCTADLIPLLGGFSNWGISKLTFAGKRVAKIGDYAFYNNNIVYLDIPRSVSVLGTGAFKYNHLRKLTFERRDSKDKPAVALAIGDDCFNRNYIAGEVFLPDVSFLGKNAFKGNPITKLTFGRKSTFTCIPEGSLAGLNIDVLYVPDSVERIESGSLAGTPVKKLIFSRQSQIKYIAPDCVDEIRKVQVIGSPVKPAFKSCY